MCGHVGTAGNLDYKDEATMKRLLVLDFFRGPDSTGFAAVRNHECEIKLAKVSSNPIELFDTKSFSSALSGSQSKVFIGHNRAATKGKINRANAHPFEFGSVVGCHNGTLDTWAWKDLEKKIESEHDVDSAAIIAGIDAIGIEEVIPTISGAWALVWYDQDNDSLNFIKNDQRPFWVAFSEDYKQLFWASEYWMMDIGLLKTGGKDKYKLATDKEGYCFFPLTDDMWYKFELTKLKAGEYKSLSDAEVKKIKGKPKVVTTTTYSGGSGTHPFTTSKTMDGGTSTGKHTKSKKHNHAQTDVVCLDVSPFDPFGAYLTKDEFMSIAAYGCSWCGADVAYDEPGIWVWAQDDIVLCADCVNKNKNDNDNSVAPSRLYM